MPMEIPIEELMHKALQTEMKYYGFRSDEVLGRSTSPEHARSALIKGLVPLVMRKAGVIMTSHEHVPQSLERAFDLEYARAQKKDLRKPIQDIQIDLLIAAMPEPKSSLAPGDFKWQSRASIELRQRMATLLDAHIRIPNDAASLRNALLDERIKDAVLGLTNIVE